MSNGGNSAGARLAHSPAIKFILIGIIVTLLMIPQFMVWGLVQEREGYANSVRAEVSRGWGIEQNVRGPFLIVPFIDKVFVVSDGKQVEQQVERTAVFLPERLDINGKAASKLLHRSIYDVSVYNADLTLSGRFETPDFARIAPNAVSVRWKDAVFAIALSNVSGLRESATLRLKAANFAEGGTRSNSEQERAVAQTINFEPSLGVADQRTSGIHAPLFASSAKVDTALPAFDFSTTLSFTGSTSLRFAPAGRETRVKLASDWPHPSFMGAYLPNDRDVGDNGFSAEWLVPHLARSVPQAWVGADFSRFNGYPGNTAPDWASFQVDRSSSSIGSGSGQPLDQLGATMFGVSFIVPIDFYDLVIRALKYGLMFLATAFGAVFVMELLSGRKVHGMQYLFVGMAMVFFYVLLLSFAEQIGFTNAYLVASMATGGMLSIYIGKILASRNLGLLMLGVFLVIYGFLYMILRMEDYALLAGAILGFVLLTATMFLTLRVDWSAGVRGRETPAA